MTANNVGTWIDSLYRERATLVAALLGATGWMFAIELNDPEEPDWPVVYIYAGKGKVITWHLTKDQLPLFSGLEQVPAGPYRDALITWDGADKEETMRRLREIAGVTW